VLVAPQTSSPPSFSFATRIAGGFGLLATNTIAQGDSSEIGKGDRESLDRADIGLTDFRQYLVIVFADFRRVPPGTWRRPAHVYRIIGGEILTVCWVMEFEQHFIVDRLRIVKDLLKKKHRRHWYIVFAKALNPFPPRSAPKQSIQMSNERISMSHAVRISQIPRITRELWLADCLAH
jgi:hypothetical protein